MADASESGWGSSMEDMLATYKMLGAITPLITAAVSGGFGASGSKPPTKPGYLQQLMVQALRNPHKPLTVSESALMNPNLLGIQQPKLLSGSALPAGLAAAGALPALLRGGSGLANIIFGGRGGGATPGVAGGGGNSLGGGLAAAAPMPVVSGAQVPQVDLSSLIGHDDAGVTMDAYPMQMPNDISLADSQALMDYINMMGEGGF